MTPQTSGAGPMADEMFEEILQAGQGARRVVEDDVAEALRRELRSLGRAAGVRLRTARVGDLVLAARLDAAVWSDDAATMRQKLAPPP